MARPYARGPARGIRRGAPDRVVRGASYAVQTREASGLGLLDVLLRGATGWLEASGLGVLGALEPELGDGRVVPLRTLDVELAGVGVALDGVVRRRGGAVLERRNGTLRQRSGRSRSLGRSHGSRAVALDRLGRDRSRAVADRLGLLGAVLGRALGRRLGLLDGRLLG